MADVRRIDAKAPAAAAGRITTRARGRADWRRVVVPYLYLAPFLLLFVVFRIAPLLYGLYLSLTGAELGADS